MSVHFISGKPGGGKTLYSVKLIVEELVHSDRIIVTNVPLKLGELNRYLQEKYPRAYERFFEFKIGDSSVAVAEVPPHITERVVLIDEDQLARFFTFRGGNVRLKSVSNEEWREGKRPDFSIVKDKGILYVLDEIHIAFNSRAWALTGNEVLYYLSQHRKLGDDVICITQSVNNVDKQFRSVAQDYTYIRNLAKQRAGFFRLPAMFVRSTYPQPATPTSAAMETGSFRLDVSGLAACYDTAKGVGIHGRAGADTKERRKGIHWLWFVIGLPLVAWFILHWLPILLVHHLAAPLRNPPPAAPVTAPAAVAPAVTPVHVVVAPVSVVAAAVTVTNYVEVQKEDDLFCIGYGGDGKQWFVALSDGSVVTTGSGRVTKITEAFVIVDGRKLQVHARPAPVAVAAPLPAGLSPVHVQASADPRIYIPVPVTVDSE